MRVGTVLLVIWPVIGAVAAGQRRYFNSSGPSGASRPRAPGPGWAPRT
jgi:hypothetical protein